MSDIANQDATRSDDLDTALPPDVAAPGNRLLAVRLLSQWGTVVVFIALLLVGAFYNFGVFVTAKNVASILNGASFAAIIAIGLTLVLVVGEFDLSIAAVATFSGVASMSMIARWHINPALAVTLALIGAALTGLANGLLVTLLRINSFIATLATSIVLLAASYGVSGGNVLQLAPDAGYVQVGQWSPIGKVGLSVWIALLLAIVMATVMRRTVPGRNLYATGGNRTAAYLAGVRVNRSVRAAFVVGAVFSGLAGVLMSMSYGYADIHLADGYLLPAFAAAFIGSSTVFLGRFHIWGTVFGALMLQVVLVVVLITGLPTEMGLAFQGVVLIVAVALSAVSRISRRY